MVSRDSGVPANTEERTYYSQPVYVIKLARQKIFILALFINHFFYILSLALSGKNYFSARKTCKEVCLLSGFLLGPIGGGLSAGIGSALYDLTSPAYVTSAPFTFVFKFLMAWACGIPYRLWKNKGKTILYSAVSGTAGFTKS